MFIKVEIPCKNLMVVSAILSSRLEIAVTQELLSTD
jgi:hypothetical protein